MNGKRRGLALLLALPMAGCVFAVSGDDDENEELRDRVRALEHRIERLEGGDRPPPRLRIREGAYLPAAPVRPVPPTPAAPPVPAREVVPGAPK